MSSGGPPVGVTLQTALHAATRTIHTNLNKMITAHLPLCLPPYSSEPTAYYLGMLMFGRLFLTFEQAISEVLHEGSPASDLKERSIQLLQTLSTQGLSRGASLTQDFKILSRKLQAQNPALAQIEERVQNQAIENTRHILTNIKSRPHLALAYTWTMYLAMFNGGRWLYKQLAAPGPEFWLESNHTEEGEDKIQALSFWRFEISPHDPNAEDLKAEFKRNFEQASEMLSEEERVEVVKEAVSLFELCLKMIEDLNTIMLGVQQATQQGPVGAAQRQPDIATANSVWHTVSSALLGPAYRMLASPWARPMRSEVKAVD